MCRAPVARARCTARGANGTAVLLPGLRYGCHRPLVATMRKVFAARGADVWEVSFSYILFVYLHIMILDVTCTAGAEVEAASPGVEIAVIATYTCYAADRVALPEGRTWEAVATAGVRYSTLLMTFRDGECVELPFSGEIDPGQIDTKRPDVEFRAVTDEGDPDWDADELLVRD